MSSDQTPKKSGQDGPSTADAKIVDIASFRKKKSTDEELARGRKPLYVSHASGKVTGSPHLKGPETADFGDRLSRIRSSLDKINRLMSELKRMSSTEQTAAKEPAKSQTQK
jgi:hypothetical protein